MAGTVRDERIKKDVDILFDLTIDDTKLLSESDLISLVNYGQLSKSVKVKGSDGSVHKMEFALLWDEDYIDLFKKTTKYANDALLRVKLVRRLRLHKSIQSIDDNDFSNVSDVRSQKLLWAILCRMSDAQIEYLDSKYSEIELERNLSVAEDIKSLDNKLEETVPDIIKKEDSDKEYTEEVVEENGGVKEEKPVEENGGVKEFSGSDHEGFIKEELKIQEDTKKEINKKTGVFDKALNKISSPKQKQEK